MNDQDFVNAISNAIYQSINIAIERQLKSQVLPFYTHAALTTLRNESRSIEPGRILRHGYKVYSQNDEDGLINEIFRRIRIKHQTFVEVGVGNGLENNTLCLLIQGWRGLWIEGNKDHCNFIQNKFRTAINKNKLTLCQSFVNTENINDLIERNGFHGEIDLLSIDIDGNDYHIFKVIDAICPRVTMIEYNSKFPPPVKWVMKYNPQHLYDSTDYFGASLKSYEILFAQKGYSLIGCNITGANAFFIRNDLVGELFCKPFTAENHYEPARPWLARGFVSGKPANYKEYETI
ncbi:MAG: FkbM family methyltransferase [Deltaproteobacteria bacterium]|nr:FkbM family methyltransferase [Deltaproteobacteria bacterium]